MNEVLLINLLSEYDSIIDFDLEFKPSRNMYVDAESKSKDVIIKQGKYFPAIYKLTLYVNEAYYVADRIFHPPIEEQIDKLNSNYFTIKYTIKFIEPLEEKALDTIRSKDRK